MCLNTHAIVQRRAYHLDCNTTNKEKGGKSTDSIKWSVSHTHACISSPKATDFLFMSKADFNVCIKRFNYNFILYGIIIKLLTSICYHLYSDTTISEVR